MEPIAARSEAGVLRTGTESLGRAGVALRRRSVLIRPREVQTGWQVPSKHYLIHTLTWRDHFTNETLERTARQRMLYSYCGSTVSVWRSGGTAPVIPTLGTRCRILHRSTPEE